jgi:hypothetical protein
VNWDVAGGQTALEATPPLDGIGLKPQHGQQNVSPASNTRFILKAKALLKSDQREWDVVIVPQSHASSFGEKALCDKDAPAVSFVLSDAQVSPQSRAVVVKNPHSRSIIVAKDGIVVELASKEETGRFKNTSMVGAWTIRAPLEPGETCSTALHDIGERLIFRTQLSCVEQ